MGGKTGLQAVEMSTDLVEIRERQPQVGAKGKCSLELCRSAGVRAGGPGEDRTNGSNGTYGARLFADAPLDCAFVPHAGNSIIGSNFCQARAARKVN